MALDDQVIEVVVTSHTVHLAKENWRVSRPHGWVTSGCGLTGMKPIISKYTTFGAKLILDLARSGYTIVKRDRIE